MIVVWSFGIGSLVKACSKTSPANAHLRRNYYTLAQRCISTVVMTPAGNILPVDCTKSWRELQWRKCDPISILKVGCCSGCGLWLKVLLTHPKWCPV